MAEKEEGNKPRSIHVKATKKIKIGKKNNNVCSNIKQEPRHTLLKRTRNLGHVKLSFCFFFVCNICKIFMFTCEPSLCLNIHGTPFSVLHCVAVLLFFIVVQTKNFLDQ